MPDANQPDADSSLLDRRPPPEGATAATARGSGTQRQLDIYLAGLKGELPAQEWAAGARKEAVFLVAVVRSKRELAARLAANKFGSPWYLRVGDAEPVPLLDWLREHHPPSRDL